jgi:PIN domain nuclease of toxin-antitoxin system
VRLLLDTAVFLWAVEDSPRLSAGARQAIADPANVLVFSAASAWEIAIKAKLGALQIAGNPADFLDEQIAVWQLVRLNITVEHAAETASLPMHHRDPFDRMLVAQAQAEGLTLVSNDPLLERYAVPILW